MSNVYGRIPVFFLIFFVSFVRFVVKTDSIHHEEHEGHEECRREYVGGFSGGG